MALAWDALKQKLGSYTLYNVKPKLTGSHTCLESGAIKQKPPTYSSTIQAHTLTAEKKSETNFFVYFFTDWGPCQEAYGGF